MSRAWEEIRNFLTRDYPCTPALKSFNGGQLIVHEMVSDMNQAPSIEVHLRELRERYYKSKEQYLSLWITFDEHPVTEEEFEKNLFKVLAPFRVGDEYFYETSRLFVVGMHPNASRMARKFPLNSIVINLWEQFDTLKGYQKLVESIRNRDVDYSGSVNPMVAKHGDDFEEIQFSGKNNPDDWKIPE